MADDYRAHVAKAFDALNVARLELTRAAKAATDKQVRADLTAAATVVYAIFSIGHLRQPQELRRELRGATIESWARGYLRRVGEKRAPPPDLATLARGLRDRIKVAASVEGMQRFPVARWIAHYVQQHAAWLADGTDNETIAEVVYASMPYTENEDMKRPGPVWDRTKARDEIFAENPTATARAALRALGCDPAEVANALRSRG